MTFDPTTAIFTDRFNPLHLQVIGTNMKGEPYVVYYDEFRSTTSIHVRTLYQGNDGTWCPGKGISIPVGIAAEVGGKVPGAISKVIIQLKPKQPAKAKRAA